MKLSEIKALQGLRVIGEDREITGVNTIENANENELCFWNGKFPYITRSKVIIQPIINYQLGQTVIIADNPKLTMAKVIKERFFWFERPEIDDSVILGNNCAIGLPGFGYVWDVDHWLRFPHIGNVVICENVEIGSNTCIDRGSIGDTIIHDGVKIDNLVHIAHNAEIGEHTLIVAGAVIGGSAKIGRNCFIGMNAGIKNGIKIGDSVTIGAGAVVICDVPDGETWAGVPAKKIK